MKGLDSLNITNTPAGAVLFVKARPGASRNRIVGVLGDALKIATIAPAEKGRANDAIARTLARTLGVKPGDVTLLSGQTHPRKQFRIAGADDRFLRDRLAAYES